MLLLGSPMQNAFTLQTHNFQLSDLNRADVLRKFEQVVSETEDFRKMRITLEGVYPTNTTVLYAARAVVEVGEDELYIETRSPSLFTSIRGLIQKLEKALAERKQALA